MNENSRRNHRKAKLELRECSDDEDDNILALQAGINKLVNLKKNLQNSSKEQQDQTTSDADPINFQVQVKVEECTDDDEQRDRAVPAAGGGAEYDAGSSVDKLFENHYYLRIVDPVINGTNNRKVTEYIFTTSSIRRALAAQAKVNYGAADRYIQIDLNNAHGDIVTPKRPPHDEILQRCLQGWSKWYETSPGFKDTPLLYKCYVCNVGWWRLHPFREHLKEHRGQILIRSEAHPYEYHVVASLNRTDEVKDVAVEGGCWRCDEPLEYHKNKASNYECDGCKVIFITCTKLKVHHAICVKYIELKFKKQIESAHAPRVCCLCGSHCVNDEQLQHHLIGHHSPRSDDPVPSQGAQCKHCEMNFFIQNYHDCLMKFRGYKCSYCCRKFVTHALLDLHNEVLSNSTVKCEICGQSLRECMMLEHMLVHTKNYGAVYWCRKCDYNILFAKYHLLLNHMRLHSKSTEKRRFVCKMLLPTRCINGEFAVSANTKELSESEVLDFITGKNHIKSKYPINRKKLLKDGVKPPVAVVVNNDVSSVKALERTEAAAADDPDDLALQLDAEIQRDLEMEEAISKVFKASNCYKKFLEKESAEPIDDYLYSDDIIILEKPNDDLIVIDSDSDDDNGSRGVADTDDGRKEMQKDRAGNVKRGSALAVESTISLPVVKDEESDFDENLVVKEEFIDDSDFDEHENDYTRDSDVEDDDVEDEGTNFSFNVDVKKEPENSDVDRQSAVDSAAELSQSSIIRAVKVEPEDSDPDTDVNKKSEKRLAPSTNADAETDNEAKKAKIELDETVRVKDEIMCSYEGEESTLDSAPEQDVFDGNKFVDAFVNIKDESNYSAEYLDPDELEDDVDWSLMIHEEMAVEVPKPKPSTSEKRAKTAAANKSLLKNPTFFSCAKCSFTAKYRKYIEHVIIKCSGRCWSCTRCGKEHEALFFYVKHLKDEHRSTCPECREVIDTVSHLHRHIVMHVRSLFFNEGKYLTDVTWTYQCRKCSEMVSLEDLFAHWESHMSADGGAGEDSTEMKRLSPEMVQSVIQRLLMHVKRNRGKLGECQVCLKKFERKNDTKRHLIEHLLTEALQDKVDTNNCLRCPICGEDMSDVYTWKLHMRDHADLPEYQCKLCQKRFSDSSNFAKHKKVHNFYSYVCDMCGGKFQAKASIVKHLMLHEQPPVHCKVCAEPFHSTSRLKVHMKQRHQLSTFPCIICKKRFGSLKDKWDHMWIEHKQRSVQADCPICMKSYRRRSDVKHHLKEEHGDQLSEIYKKV